MCFCLAPVHIKEKDMQCESVTWVRSNQRVKLPGFVYMSYNKLTYAVKWKNGTLSDQISTSCTLVSCLGLVMYLFPLAKQTGPRGCYFSSF